MSKTHTRNIVGTPEIVPYPNRFESAKPHLTIWQGIRFRVKKSLGLSITRRISSVGRAAVS